MAWQRGARPARQLSVGSGALPGSRLAQAKDATKGGASAIRREPNQIFFILSPCRSPSLLGTGLWLTPGPCLEHGFTAPHGAVRAYRLAVRKCGKARKYWRPALLAPVRRNESAEMRAIARQHWRPALSPQVRRTALRVRKAPSAETRVQVASLICSEPPCTASRSVRQIWP